MMDKDAIQPVTTLQVHAEAQPRTSTSQEKLKAFGGKIKHGAVKSVAAAVSVVDDFKEFLNRGNVFDLAVGLVMGTAFTAIVTSFVSDIITPIIGLVSKANLANSYIILRCPDNFTDCQDFKGRFGTPAVANAAGIVTWNWGKFLDSVINFAIISAILFFFVKIYASTFRRKNPATTKDCDFCCKTIPKKATRCPFCTSDLEPVEEKPVSTTPPVIDIITHAIPQVFRHRK